jgi:hypothetical protein
MVHSRPQPLRAVDYRERDVSVLDAAPAVIPYDYAASFELRGVPGRMVHDVINVSADGIFVAVAIGYGFEEDRGRGVGFARPAAQVDATFVPGDVTLGQIPAHALVDGVRIDSFHERYVFRADGRVGLPAAMPVPPRELSDIPLPGRLALADPEDREPPLVQRLRPKNEISFLFSIADSATGRELQDEPIHNIASLGTSSGIRPFRQFAYPMAFQPRSSIRLQIVERTEDARGTLFIVLYGYRLLTTNCPEPLVRSVRGDWPCPVETIGDPSSRVIPFDYVATFSLAGERGRLVDAEIPINVEGGYIATAIGYGLATDGEAVRPQWERLADNVQPLAQPLLQPIPFQDAVTNWRRLLRQWADGGMNGPAPAPPVLADLGLVPLRVFAPDALSDGIRIRPEYVRLALRDDGALAQNLPVSLVDELFESLNRSEDVQFRYRIFESGRGLDLQNQPIGNIAGLGIANGDRPFKRFPRPMTFHPRSTIRVTIEERQGRGLLFIVFQGYKILAGGGEVRS